MKAVILAGGKGTRISEESASLPKPLIQIGDLPILVHIMKTYSHYGINDFIICLGYKGYLIKEYFSNYFLHTSDVTFEMDSNTMHVHDKRAEPWCVTLVDTGEDTMTGGRLKRVANYLGDDDFCMTYGDGLADVNISALLEFHRKTGKMATVTAVQPPGRFGAMEIVGDIVTSFCEKPDEGGWINGGYFVLSPKVLDFIRDDSTPWEKAPVNTLALSGQLSTYKHKGFFQPMDTLREKNLLEELWGSGKAPWKVW